MKKIIVGTLAVIGGITVGLTALVVITSTVVATKAKKRDANMTPEEREERERMKQCIDDVFASFADVATPEATT